MTSSTVPSVFNMVPQFANMQLTYAGALSANQYMSLVDINLDPYNPDNGPVNPCVKPGIAAAAADATHSGSLQAPAGSKTITIPQTTLLDASKTFAICYAK